jgi:serine/threonine protein phosphatase PrpC
MSFEIGATTDVGRRRTGNEDAVDVLELPDTQGVLCVVADGMGGHQAGEVASRIAVETIRQVFGREADGPDVLIHAIQAANRMVYVEAASDPTKEGMGTTVVCVLLQGGLVQAANVGDSPAFLVREQQARRITRDHSWIAEEIARGAISPDEAVGHPYRHILTRCLGLAAQVEVEAYDPLELLPGDVLILCSDGLSEHVAPDEFVDILDEQPSQAAADALVALANERGGTDNISVVVARFS